jgi:DNA-binding XRE family transcriptional regulator
MRQHVNDNQVRDYDVALDAEFGASGTPERVAAEEQAYAFYSGQIIRDARREEKVTQSELASRIGTTKSYISKIENGAMTPSVSTFYRIIGALGMRVEIVRPVRG